MKDQKKTKPFYQSKKWQETRARILRRDNYQCQEAKRYGRMVPADTVHHIFPIEQYPEYRLAAWNLISLSREAHERMHDRSSGTLTELGEEYRRRTAKKQGVPLENAEVDRIPDELTNQRRTLIIGLPGAGKTTEARKRMRADTLVYDLDYIAAAFRISSGDPHKGQTDAARRMANDLLGGFALNVGKYARDIIFIRTAPSIEEVETLRPSQIIYMDGCRDPARLRGVDAAEKRQKIFLISKYAKEKNIFFKKLIACDEDPRPL